MGIVYRKNNLFFAMNKQISHTGSNTDSRWVEDINHAFVFHTLPESRIHGLLEGAEKLEVMEVRTVRIV